MLEQDFDKLKEIAKELNEIRVRNNLTELQMRADNDNRYFIDNVMLLTREEYRDDFGHFRERCRITRQRTDMTAKEFSDMDYNEYLNYK